MCIVSHILNYTLSSWEIVVISRKNQSTKILFSTRDFGIFNTPIFQNATENSLSPCSEAFDLDVPLQLSDIFLCIHGFQLKRLDKK